MWFGLTIARSSPASTQWCRKTELSTARAASPMPKETLETPSEVSTPGSSALISRMPSIVSTADGFHSSSPVVSVNVSASKISSCGSIPCSSHDEVVDALRDLELALARLGHADLVDRQRDQRGAVRRARSASTRSSLARPASRLTELTIARPGIWSSAVSITSGSVESTWIGAGWVERDRLGHAPHLLVLVLALGQRDAQVEHVRAALDLVLGDLHEAVVVVGEQQLLGLARALRVDALADQRRARVLGERRRGDHRGHVRRARRGARRRLAAADALDDRRDVLGRRAAAAADDRRRRSARRTRRACPPAASGCSGKIVSPFGPWCGMPAFGMHWTGTGENSPRKRIASRMSSGPVEQLRPIASTLSASSVASTALMSVPSSILPPLGSSETDVWSGTARPIVLERLAGAEDGGLDLEDVLRGLDDQQVGAALDEAARLLLEDRPRARGSGSARASGRRRPAGGRSGRSSRRRSGARRSPRARSRPPCG